MDKGKIITEQYVVVSRETIFELLHKEAILSPNSNNLFKPDSGRFSKGVIDIRAVSKWFYIPIEPHSE